MGKIYKTNLQAMRKRAGFKSAREFAEYIGVNVGSYTNYEQGKVALSLLKAWEFADALNCTLDELAGRRAPKKPSITPDEQRMLDVYRDAPQEQRYLIDALIDAEARQMDESALKEAGIA